MVTGDAEGRAEMPGARAEGSGRYPREQAEGVSNTTVKTDYSPEEKMVRLMEAVVERENMIFPHDSGHGVKLTSQTVSVFYVR